MAFARDRKAVLREKQADSTSTGYHKIGNTKSHISFPFGKKYMVCVSLQYVLSETRSSGKLRRLQGRTVFTHTYHLSSSLCQATDNLCDNR